MVIKLTLPPDAADTFLQAWGDGLDRAALEALVIEGYRTGKFGTAMVRRLLGLESRWEAESWLGQRGVHWNYTLEDLEADRRTLERLWPERD
jgi:hypothetical protein